MLQEECLPRKKVRHGGAESSLRTFDPLFSWILPFSASKAILSQAIALKWASIISISHIAFNSSFILRIAFSLLVLDTIAGPTLLTSETPYYRSWISEAASCLSYTRQQVFPTLS